MALHCNIPLQWRLKIHYFKASVPTKYCHLCAFKIVNLFGCFIHCLYCILLSAEKCCLVIFSAQYFSYMTKMCKCKISLLHLFFYDTKPQTQTHQHLLHSSVRLSIMVSLMTATAKVDENLLLEFLPGASLCSLWLSFTAKCILSQWGVMKDRDEAIFLHHPVMKAKETRKGAGAARPL